MSYIETDRCWATFAPRRLTRAAEVNTTVKLGLKRLYFLRGETGQGLAEYALILALIGVASIIAVTFMGGSINAMLSDLGNRF